MSRLNFEFCSYLKGLQGVCRRDCKAMLSISAWIAVGIKKHTGEDFRQQYVQTGPVSDKEYVCSGYIHSCLGTLHCHHTFISTLVLTS